MNIVIVSDGEFRDWRWREAGFWGAKSAMHLMTCGHSVAGFAQLKKAHKKIVIFEPNAIFCIPFFAWLIAYADITIAWDKCLGVSASIPFFSAI